MPPILAHGALGGWDELIFISVIVVFVMLMGISWIRNRYTQPDFKDKTSDHEHFKLE